MSPLELPINHLDTAQYQGDIPPHFEVFLQFCMHCVALTSSVFCQFTLFQHFIHLTDTANSVREGGRKEHSVTPLKYIKYCQYISRQKISANVRPPIIFPFSAIPSPPDPLSLLLFTAPRSNFTPFPWTKLYASDRHRDTALICARFIYLAV